MTEPPPTYHTGDDLILALDASTTAVGWCRAIGDLYVESGVFEPQGDDAWNRIAQVGDWLDGVLWRSRPHVVAVEESCGDRGNRRTDRLLGAVLGVVRYCVQRYEADFVLVNPQKVKATKFCKDTPLETSLLVGKQVKGDEADAIGVWQAYLVEIKTAAWAG